MADSNLSFSVREVPDSWTEAAADGPQGTPGPLIDRRPGSRRLPSGAKPDLVTGALTGIAMTIISGAAWYAINLSGTYRGPWLAIALGALVAIAVRLGAGAAGPEMRLTVGAALYIVGLVATTFIIIRGNFIALYGRSPSFGQTEDILTSDYLTDPLTMVTWVGGFALMSWASFALKRFR